MNATVQKICVTFVIALLFGACEDPKELSSINPINWKKRSIDIPNLDSISSGSTYLSVYSEIYSRTERSTIDLTATVSIRNINQKDTIFLTKAEYYNTQGELIRSYFKKPVYVAPLETIEIIIDQDDQEGGSGANFVFDWVNSSDVHEPYFESVMISTYGQQGLSFTSRGVRIK